MLLQMAIFYSFYQSSSVTQLCPALCDPMDCSMPGFPVHHHLLEFAQTHVCWVSDAIQPSRFLSSPSPLAFNLFMAKWYSIGHKWIYMGIYIPYMCISYLLFLLFLLFWPCPMAGGILAPWRRKKPVFPALQGRFLTTGPMGKSLPHLYPFLCHEHLTAFMSCLPTLQLSFVLSFFFWEW